MDYHLVGDWPGKSWSNWLDQGGNLAPVTNHMFHKIILTTFIWLFSLLSFFVVLKLQQTNLPPTTDFAHDHLPENDSTTGSGNSMKREKLEIWLAWIQTHNIIPRRSMCEVWQLPNGITQVNQSKSKNPWLPLWLLVISATNIDFLPTNKTVFRLQNTWQITWVTPKSHVTSPTLFYANG